MLFLTTVYRQLLCEYNHTLERCRVLSQAVDAVLADNAPPTGLGTATPTRHVTEEDVVAYLRWLVYRQHVTKEPEAFIRVSYCYMCCFGEITCKVLEI